MINNLMKRNLFAKKVLNRKFFSSHVEQIYERDSHFIEKLKSANEISTSDFLNFTRVITQRKVVDKDIWATFDKHLPNHISNLDEFGIRKVCSALESNADHDENTIQKLKSKIKSIRHSQGISEEEYQSRKYDVNRMWFKMSGPQHRAWMRYTLLRDWVMSKFSFGILK
jgi:hypothetical protein